MSLKGICVYATFLALACTCMVWGESYDFDTIQNPLMTGPGSSVPYPWSRNDHSQRPMLPSVMTNSELFKAVIDFAPRMVRIALERGADPNYWIERRFNGKVNALHCAAADGNCLVLSLLIKGGANIELPDDSGWTPLHKAANSGYRDAAELLISNGAIVDSKDHWGRTPLMYASKQGRSATARFLIQNGAQPHLTDVNGKSAIDWARSTGYEDVETIIQGRERPSSAYQGSGPPFGAPGHFNEPGHSAANQTKASQRLIAWVRRGSLLEVKKALEAGADVNFQNKNGHTALMFAAFGGRRQIAECLLNNKANCGIKDKGGRTCLYYAAARGRTDEVARLLDAGAEIDCVSVGNYTPLIIAARKGRYETVKLLIQKGATVSVQDSMGRTARMVAQRVGYRKIVQLLAAHEGRPAKYMTRDSTPRDGGASHLVPKDE